MTVKELIEKLQGMPQDAKVFMYLSSLEDDDDVNGVRMYIKEDVEYDDWGWGRLCYCKVEIDCEEEKEKKKGE